MRFYVIGRLGNLEVGDRVHVEPERKGRSLGGSPMKIPPTFHLSSEGKMGSHGCDFNAKGAAIECTTPDGCWYARRLPADVGPVLNAIESAIGSAEVALKALYKQREVYLASVVNRGEVITMSDVTANPEPERMPVRKA